MIDLLAAPIEDLLRSVGTGISQSDSVHDVVRTSAATLIDTGRAVSDVLAANAGTWTGPAADAATEMIGRSLTTATSLAAHADQLQAIAAEAHAAVARGSAELQAILSSFVAGATTLLPTAVTPAGHTALVTLAGEHLDRATVVCGRVRAELDQLARRTASLVVPSTPRSSPNALIRSVLTPTHGAASGYTVDHTSIDSFAPSARTDQPSTGSLVTLPDGSTALAPNEQAADAVRFALDQQGTPYVWGGTTPGQGLDCSGLTQSAYGQAGVDIPRLAADQSVGSPVGVDDLMPGDLAVWDGHVAMIVGNGQMVEAGDPVSVSPIRTSNLDMDFHGFYRPTT